MDLREKMLAMLDSTRIEEDCCEISGNLLIVVSFARMNNSNVYIVAENDLHTYVRLFKSYGLNVHKVVCSLPKEFQKVDDVEIISPQALLTDKTPRKVFLLFALDINISGSSNFFATQINNIPAEEIPNLPFVVNEHDARRWNLDSIPKFDSNRIFYYQSHKEDLMNLFDSLADYRSKLALYYYVESYIANTVYKGEQISTLWRYFFGGKYERLYKHLDGECWINCGANTGDTLFQYLCFNFKPKKIYAFEADKGIYDVMINNLRLLPPEKRNLIETFNEKLGATTDFEKILAGNKLTLLNADIEGAELPMLQSMKDIIQSDRPVMAICVYHLKEDLLTVPQFLQSICQDYVYYLRKYTAWYGSLKKNEEVIFYAVPIERSILHAPPLHFNPNS